jgi:hypothetical protein
MLLGGPKMAPSRYSARHSLAQDALERRQTCEAAGQTWHCGQQAALALADHVG